MIHLDTSFLVDLLRERAKRSGGPATEFLASIAEEDLAASVFVVCELQAGAELARRPAVERTKIEALLHSMWIDFPDERFAPTYGALLSKMRRGGDRIATMDLLIATSAVLAGAELATRNRRDFERVPGLALRVY